MGLWQTFGEPVCCHGRLYSLRALLNCGRRKLRRVSRELVEECIPVPPWSSACDGEKAMTWSDMDCRGEEACVVVGCCGNLRPRVQRQGHEEPHAELMPVCSSFASTTTATAGSSAFSSPVRAPTSMATDCFEGRGLPKTRVPVQAPALASSMLCDDFGCSQKHDVGIPAPAAEAPKLVPSVLAEEGGGSQKNRPPKSAHALLEMQRALDRMADADAADSTDDESGPPSPFAPEPVAEPEPSPPVAAQPCDEETEENVQPPSGGDVDTLDELKGDDITTQPERELEEGGWVCVQEMTADTFSWSSDDEVLLCEAPPQGKMVAAAKFQAP